MCSWMPSTRGQVGDLARHEGGIDHRQAPAIDGLEVARGVAQIGVGLGLVVERHVHATVLGVPLARGFDEREQRRTALTRDRGHRVVDQPPLEREQGAEQQRSAQIDEPDPAQRMRLVG